MKRLHVRYGWRHFFGPDPYPYTLELVAQRDDTRSQAQFVLDALGPPGQLILDAGCGQGRHSVLFAEGGHRVVGLDLSANAVSVLADRPDVWPVVANLVHLPIADGTFDAVVSLYSSIGYDRDLVPALREFRRTTRKRGQLVIDLTNVRSRRIGSESLSTGKGYYITQTIGSRRWHLAVALKSESAALYGFSYPVPRLRKLLRLLACTGWTSPSVFGDYDGEEYCPSSSKRILVIAWAS